MKNTLFYLAIVFSAALRCACAADISSLSPVDLAAEAASADVRHAAGWVVAHADNQNLPFAIVDKKNARMFVFEADGRLRGATVVLLGAGAGDASVPGIASRAPSSLRPEERTTPAGRFMSEPGHNLDGEDIVWVEYSAKIAIHRLRPGAARERRAAGLASAGTDDNRVSFGCIVVPVGFYDAIVKPVLGKHYGVVYVLPEGSAVDSMFETFAGA